MASPSSFREAKQALKKVYSDHQETFYCGCEIVVQGRKWSPDLASCGYKARKDKDRRAYRVEFEHVVPASWLGRQLQCWQEGGRKHCRAVSAQFNKMEAEMINLVPASGEINRDRSNFRYGEIPGEKRRYGACDFEVDFKQRIAEPRAQVRGNIARIFFFMRDRYSLRLSKAQTRLLTGWDKKDPIDAWEIERNNKIKNIQGYGNPYVGN
jgi:deoxyribonuclease-1